MDGPPEYYAKRNKSEIRKCQEPYDFTHMWDMELKVMDTDSSVVVTRGKGVGRWGVRGA